MSPTEERKGTLNETTDDDDEPCSHFRSAALAHHRHSLSSSERVCQASSGLDFLPSHTQKTKRGSTALSSHPTAHAFVVEGRKGHVYDDLESSHVLKFIAATLNCFTGDLAWIRSCSSFLNSTRISVLICIRVGNVAICCLEQGSPQAGKSKFWSV